MNIYKVSQDVNNDYDTYGAFIRYAKDEEEARYMPPDDIRGMVFDKKRGSW